MKPLATVLTTGLLVVLAAGCGRTPAASTPQPLPLDPNDPLVQDAQQYAQDQGVDLEEAVRRLEAQDAIGELNAALEAREADTFAGLWIQHEPYYRVIVAFTENGPETMQPYLEDFPWPDLIEVRDARYSLAQLQHDQTEAFNLVVEELAIPAGSGIDITNNRVELYVGDLERLEAALQQAGKRLPGSVLAVEEPELDAPGEPNRVSVSRIETAKGSFLFVRQPPQLAQMAALLEGRLVESDGCLQVVPPEGGPGYLMLWPADFGVQAEGDTIEILDGEGNVAARAGEAIQVGGGEVPGSAYENLPLAECPGPYWAAGDLLSTPEPE